MSCRYSSNWVLSLSDDTKIMRRFLLAELALYQSTSSCGRHARVKSEHKTHHECPLTGVNARHGGHQGEEKKSPKNWASPRSAAADFGTRPLLLTRGLAASSTPRTPRGR